jgi:hypothetical protein
VGAFIIFLAMGVGLWSFTGSPVFIVVGVGLGIIFGLSGKRR